MKFITKSLSDYKKLFLKEVLVQIFEKTVRVFVGLFVIRELSSYLGPSYFGIYNFIESVYLIFLGISIFGIDLILVKLFTSKKKINLLFGNGALLLCVFSISSIVIIVIMSFIFFDDQKSRLLICVSSALLFTPFSVVDYYLTSINKIRVASLYKLLAYLIKSSLFLFFVYYELELIFFVSAIIIETLVLSILLLSYFIRNKIKISFKPNRAVMKEILVPSFYVFLYSLGAILYHRIDIIMIEIYLSDSDMGYYTAALKFLMFFYFIPQIISQTLFPRIIRNINSNNYESISTKNMYRLSFFSSLFIFLILIVLGDFMLLLLYGELYLSSHTILSILAVNIIIESIANINSKVLYSKNLEKKMLPRIFVGILANISLNITLIPLMGINGVALSTVISIIIVEFFYDFFDPVLRDIHFFKLKSIFLIPTK